MLLVAVQMFVDLFLVGFVVLLAHLGLLAACWNFCWYFISDMDGEGGEAEEAHHNKACEKPGHGHRNLNGKGCDALENETSKAT